MKKDGGNASLKRVYVLVAVGILQLVVGSALILQAAEPLSRSEDVLISAGGYYHIEFGILQAGQLSGNFFERQGRSVDFFVFDVSGYSSFLDSSDSVPPLSMLAGTNVSFDVNLAGPGQYHLVFGHFPGREERLIHLNLLEIGLKTSETLLGAVILAGGLALFAASLLMSLPSLRRSPAVPPRPGVPSHPRSSSPQKIKQDPSKDDTRLY